MAENPFADGVAEHWTAEQWNAFVSSTAFINNYTSGGVVNIDALVASIGTANYLLLLDHAKHIVQVGKKLISSDTEEGKHILTDELYEGNISLMTCVHAGVVSGNEADDRIQDAMTASDMCLRPKRDWDERNLFAAMHWSPDEWHEGMKYIGFSDTYSKGGILNSEKLLKYMPKQLFDRMVNRATNLIHIDGKIIDADTVAGQKMVDKALVSGDVTLAVAIACGAYTKEEGIAMYKVAVAFAATHLLPDSTWGDVERAEAYSWINEQWDAFIDTPQFDVFVEKGIVDIRALHKVLGPKLFNHMVDRSKVLIEIRPYIIDIARLDGRKFVMDALAEGNARLAPLVRADLMTQEEMDRRIAVAEATGAQVFSGAGWTDELRAVAMHWTMGEWDSALKVGGFSKKYTRNGQVDIVTLLADMGPELVERMVKRSIYLVDKNNGIIDGQTDAGAQIIEKGLWTGDTSVEEGLVLGLLSREDALKLFREAETLGKKYREGGIWSEEDRASAMTWSADQWKRAVDRMELSLRYGQAGVLDSQKLTLAMGPKLFDAMIDRVDFLYRNGKNVIDSSTKEGEALLPQEKSSES
ncbi:MAG: hypothetical protein O2904_02910 [bacterium]|nr:hypothetical protein [bacterium]